MRLHRVVKLAVLSLAATVFCCANPIAQATDSGTTIKNRTRWHLLVSGEYLVRGRPVKTEGSVTTYEGTRFETLFERELLPNANELVRAYMNGHELRSVHVRAVNGPNPHLQMCVVSVKYPYTLGTYVVENPYPENAPHANCRIRRES